MNTIPLNLRVQCFFIFYILFLNFSYSQSCQSPGTQTVLDVNDVRAMIKNGGDLWWDGNNAQYVVPTPPVGEVGVSALFAGSIWMGGLDQDGNLKLAAQTYGAALGDYDYYPGPLDENGETTNEQCNQFDQIWTTNSADINLHRVDYGIDGTIDGPVPSSILFWPGQGNPQLPNFPNQQLAPFIDVNGDGLYNPMDGDYPNIKDADQAHWTVFNDAGNFHSESGGTPIGLEVQLLAYAYSSTDALNETTFYDYTFINRSGETLDSTFTALWVDADLGCSVDDYFGCSPENNMAFVYNTDALDGDVPGSCGCFGTPTYCNEIPVVGIKLLKGISAERIFASDGSLVSPAPGQSADTIIDLGMSNFMLYNNGGALPSPTLGTTDPNTPNEFYNYMTGSWLNGLPLTSGNDGYNPGSSDITKYAFPGNPAIGSEWSMCSEDLNTIDRRMVISSGPFRFEAGAINTLSFAVVYKADVPHPCPDISGLIDVADEVQAHFDENTVTSVDNILETLEIGSTIFPNPFSNQTQLLLDTENDNFSEVQIFSVTGQLVRTYAELASNRLIIQKDDLISGMYFYKGLTKKNKTCSGKMLIR